jgi:DNA-directed RNA polymerase I and III subunit RPAC1
LPLPPLQVRRLCEQERWASAIALRKVKDHFIFTVESTGVLPPAVLVERALDILSAKALAVAGAGLQA